MNAHVRRMPENPAIPLEMPVEMYGDVEMTKDATGGLTPTRMVKGRHKLEDQTVRIIIAHALALSGQIARFRVHTMDDVVAFQDQLAEQFGGKRGGAKGNVTLKSFDDCLKVEVKTQSLVTYGALIATAKSLFDQFVKENSAGTSEELLALITHAFQVDQEGKINRSRLVQLKRLEIENETWKKAMAALDEAEVPAGSRAYVRFFWRENVEAAWSSITVDIAAQ